ncbi:MAG: plasmid stabilization system protein ParE [Phenylobacterium sp.]|jgi:plasmid stabilization system protein ParE
MKVEFLQLAQFELDDAFDYYERQLSGLGASFIAETTAVLTRIVERPDAWQKCSKRTRKCLLHKFPYAVIYQIRDENILIVAIAHQRRKPNYWQTRINN